MGSVLPYHETVRAVDRISLNSQRVAKVRRVPGPSPIAAYVYVEAFANELNESAFRRLSFDRRPRWLGQKGRGG